MKHKILLIILAICSFKLKAQDKKTIFGIQYKPIIPVTYFNTANTENKIENFMFELNPKFSYSLGMVVRQKINHIFSVESGLNYIQRNFRLNILNNDSSFLLTSDYTDFSMRSYEIPVQLLTYIQTSERWFVNAAFGLSYNNLASDVFSIGKSNQQFYQNTFRRQTGYVALLANIGVEYRTYEKGNYYFGTSLHRPFKEIARIYPSFNSFNSGEISNEHFYLEMIGNFISIDFRYFFNE